MKHFKYILLLTIVLLTGCGVEHYLLKNGKKYKLVREGYTNSEGVVFVPLYEIKGVTNYYYTPSLSGNDMVTILR